MLSRILTNILHNLIIIVGGVPMKVKEKKILIGVVIAILVIVMAVVLFLVLRKPTFTILFNSDETTTFEEIKVKKGETITLPDKNPTKEGYVFSGWTFKNETPLTENYKVKENITFYAKWIKEGVKTFTIVFDSNGGSKIEPIILEKGETLKLPENPTKSGYRFNHWEDKNGIPIYDEALLDIEGEYVLKAIWDKEEEKEDNSNKDIAITGVSLDKATVDLIIGATGKLNATVSPSNATNKSVTYSSSDSSIIKVDNNGNLTAVGIGNATITVKTNNGKTAESTVYSDVESLSLTRGGRVSPSDYISKYGDAQKSVTYAVSSTPSVDAKYITWYAPDATGQNAVAYNTIASTGKSITITARDNWSNSASSVPVTVKVGRKSFKVTVYVEPELKVYSNYNEVSILTVDSRDDFKLTTYIPVTWTISSEAFLVSGFNKTEKSCSAQVYNDAMHTEGFRVFATSKAGQKSSVSITVNSDHA